MHIIGQATRATTLVPTLHTYQQQNLCRTTRATALHIIRQAQQYVQQWQGIEITEKGNIKQAQLTTHKLYIQSTNHSTINARGFYLEVKQGQDKQLFFRDISDIQSTPP